MKLSFLFLILFFTTVQAQQKRPRELGIKIGVMKTGQHNAITDVAGVRVGHVTINEGDKVHTGVTAIIPHEGNLFQEKVPAAIFIANGFGKLTGISQVQELGNLETPIILTNTLSVPTAADALIDYTVSQKGNEAVRSVNSVVGETNDKYLNDIVGRHVKKEDVKKALDIASGGKVEEGCVGAGTGTICFNWKGGIGTASRVLPKELGGYTVGVIVQTNFDGILQVNGVPVGEELKEYFLVDELNKPADGSCMIVVATDAPLTARNLERVAKRAIFGLAKTGGIASNGSGDYVIAFSTAKNLRVPHTPQSKLYEISEIHNDDMSSLFLAAIEATEEAIINSLFAAKTTKGFTRTIQALPVDKVLEISRKYNKVK